MNSLIPTSSAQQISVQESLNKENESLSNAGNFTEAKNEDKIQNNEKSEIEEEEKFEEAIPTNIENSKKNVETE